jgi:hypothetical protein
MEILLALFSLPLMLLGGIVLDAGTGDDAAEASAPED